ncbi:hypothetical protein HYD72_00910 [Mycoplasmopsis bovis]|nr:hypothetical protein [Mycoplasmopsis bovis]QQH49242.1 hypothetical protein HYD72_00910 [Mycoplasmopsis bovis]
MSDLDKLAGYYKKRKTWLSDQKISWVVCWIYRKKTFLKKKEIYSFDTIMKDQLDHWIKK